MSNMSNASDDLVLVQIRRGGRKTHVSLDWLLFEWLSHRHGGVLAAQAWIRRAVHRIEVLQEEGDALVRSGRIGFSRLIQRLIVKDLIDAAGGIGRALGDGHVQGHGVLLDALKKMDAEDGGSGVDEGAGVVGVPA